MGSVLPMIAAVVIMVPAASVIVMVMTTVSVPVPLISVTAAIATPLGVCMLVAVADPLFAHEIDGSATGAVTRTVTPPVLLVHRGNVKVHGRRADRPRRHKDRLGVDNGRRRVATANIDLAINAGLIDADRYPYLRIDGRHNTSGECERDQFFHRDIPKFNSP